MDFNTLKPALGSTRSRKRLGRGAGSGHGKTAAKGHKGQKARSGGSIKAGFEGGQMPLQRRIPKRGFNPIDRNVYSLVNINQLDIFAPGTKIDNLLLQKYGLIKDTINPVKLLGTGDLSKSFIVSLSKFSESAKEKITAAGGSFEEIV